MSAPARPRAVCGSARERSRARASPKPELKRIFKRFYRIHGPIATRVKGTGLGLYIVRSVAKRHGGRAWAESGGSGQGSTFVIHFQFPGSGEPMNRILVVEDEQHLAEGLRFNLEAEGYQVEVVETGEAALDLLFGPDKARHSTSWCSTSCFPERTASKSSPRCARPASSSPP